jgi:hypothetical protein
MIIFVQILVVLLVLAAISYGLFRFHHYRRNINRSWNLAFLKINIPKKESKEDREIESDQYASKDFKEVVGIMAHFYEALYAISGNKWEHMFKGEEFLSLEYVVLDGSLYFYILCPRNLISLVEKQITGFYPDVFLEEVKDYEIFKPDCKYAGTYMRAGKEFIYPIKNYNHLKSDPLNTITNVVSKIGEDEGAAIQIMIRPAPNGWQKACKDLAQNFDSPKKSFLSYLNVLKLFTVFFDIIFKPDSLSKEGDDAPKSGGSSAEEIKAIEEKAQKIGYETIVRVVTSAKTQREADSHLTNIKSAFAQYASQGLNGFGFTKWHSVPLLIKNFLLRRFRRSFVEWLRFQPMLLSSDELASIFHLPNIKYNRAPTIAWQNYKNAPPPTNLPEEGLLLGHNTYRGVTKEVRMKREDRFRHFYVIGQTGTGKSSIFQTMIRQDFQNGDGVCVVDPHGSLIEDLLPFIPRERADDVIIFNPADTERPMGLNLLEADSPDEMDLVALDAMNIMIKLFNEEIFGPRIQDYFRNGCLTLMEDPEGGALTDIVRLFTDDDFQRLKVEKVKNPIVRSFWENQMAKTGAREKAEMIPYFAAKFGQFVTNTLMRNIIGQTKSAFDFGKVMQEQKILLMNLSKGETGDINSKLLGLIIVSKIQMAALRRQRIAKSERKDFFLYIDEFQNYITDSIESILSEARKYRLGLNIAHQYLKQLEGDKEGTTKIRDAVFGNVGSMMCYKIGAQDAEYMAKEMTPVFADQDLINIDKYKAVMKLSIDTQPSRPFSIVPKNPYTDAGDKEAAEAFVQLSRLKFGRDKEFVEREILRRMGAI